MSYESVDALQKVLVDEVFHYASDAKKAAGRALGTLVEVITFHLLKGWGYEKHTLIERRIAEYANPSLTHNVEFTLHPSQSMAALRMEVADLPFSASKIRKQLPREEWTTCELKSTQLLSSRRLLRNSCVIYECGDEVVAAYLGEKLGTEWQIYVQALNSHPVALFECKRVGVEEGMRKGPQTIEKAKQGAYVARSVSSLQKIRTRDGSLYGVLPMLDGTLEAKPYDEIRKTIINSSDQNLLKDFTLTIGVVSNHGNWFTSGDQNKELRVLAQSYDWLLFLTDEGLTRFTDDLLLSPSEDYRWARQAFIDSYPRTSGPNMFTKIQMLLSADTAIQEYFAERLYEIENWLYRLSVSQP